MDYQEELSRINLEIEEFTNNLESAESEHAKAKAKIDQLQSLLTEMRSIRDTADAAIKDNKKSLEAAEKKRREIQIEIATKQDTVSKEYLDKLDRRAKKFHWDKFILPKQREGAYRIAHNKHMLLGDEMGTGKTITAIASADLTLVRHLLVLVPAKLAGNFAAEFKKWAPHRYVLNLAQQTSAIRSAQIEVLKVLHDHKKPTVLILNYESWANNYSLIQAIIDLRFEGVIMDEAHHFKNKDTHAFKGIKQIVMAINTCALCKGPVGQINQRCTECNWDANTADSAQLLKAKSMRKLVLPMTGTFLMNSPADIWPALNIILPKSFDEERTFLEVFATQDYNGKWIFKPGGAESLATRLGSKYIKRTMADMGITLPRQISSVEQVTLDNYPEQKEILNNLAKHAAIQIAEEKVESISAIIALITRQRQAAADPNSIVIQEKDYYGEVVGETRLNCGAVAKLDYLESKVSEDVLFNGKRVVIFSQFSSIFPEMKKRLESLGIKVAVCDGKTTKKEMEVIRQDFDRNSPDKGQYQVVIANFRVGGAGLNFTDATKTYEFDSPWNPAMRDQAKARTRRIGQTEETEYIILELAGTIDQWMRNLVSYKEDMIAGFDNAADANKTELADLLKQALTKGVTE